MCACTVMPRGQKLLLQWRRLMDVGQKYIYMHAGCGCNAAATAAVKKLYASGTLRAAVSPAAV